MKPSTNTNVDVCTNPTHWTFKSVLLCNKEILHGEQLFCSFWSTKSRSRHLFSACHTQILMRLFKPLVAIKSLSWDERWEINSEKLNDYLFQLFTCHMSYCWPTALSLAFNEPEQRSLFWDNWDKEKQNLLSWNISVCNLWSSESPSFFAVTFDFLFANVPVVGGVFDITLLKYTNQTWFNQIEVCIS